MGLNSTVLTMVVSHSCSVDGVGLLQKKGHWDVNRMDVYI